jgi:hypothetical protein
MTRSKFGGQLATRVDSTAALRSQRRFLVIISIAVAGYYYLQVHTEGSGEYGGFHVKLGRADRVPYALWIIFSWALLRYVQRLHEQWRRVRREVMRQFEHYDHQLALAAARRSLRARRGQAPSVRIFPHPGEWSVKPRLPTP